MFITKRKSHQAGLPVALKFVTRTSRIRYSLADKIIQMHVNGPPILLHLALFAALAFLQTSQIPSWQLLLLGQGLEPLLSPPQSTN